MFKKATKKRLKAKIALIGPSGSGKTYSALAIAQGLLATGQRIAVIDAERGSSAHYSDEFDFDMLEIQGDYHPRVYCEAIDLAAKSRYGVVIVDSLSHAWAGPGGCLAMKDVAGERVGENTFTAWRHVTPHHQALIDAILSAPLHLLCTMRAKTEYVISVGKGGRQIPRKVGMAPVQRDGIDYEFDVVGELDHSHALTVSKTRARSLADRVVEFPGAEFGAEILEWLSRGGASDELVFPAIREDTIPGVAYRECVSWLQQVAPDLVGALRLFVERRRDSAGREKAATADMIDGLRDLLDAEGVTTKEAI